MNPNEVKTFMITNLKDSILTVNSELGISVSDEETNELEGIIAAKRYELSQYLMMEV